MHALPQSVPPALQQATADPRLCQSPGPSQASLGHGVTAPFSWVLVHKMLCLYLPKVYCPVLCKFWQLCGGVNGNLLLEGLCHTQVCCIQSPCPCGRPLLTCTSAGDNQTLKGRSDSASVGSLGPSAHKILFEPSKHLWQIWDLILNGTLSLLQSCWDFLLGLHTGDRQMVSTGVILF